MRTIVTAQWLNENLNKANLVILDASIATSAGGKEFKKFESTIPNARRFDLKNVFSDKSSSFPNTVPKPQEFELECRKLGINQNSEIIVFDNNGVYSSPRVWWLFKVMGHSNIAVLDGGLPDWIFNGYRTESKHLSKFKPGDFKASYKEDFVISFQQVEHNLTQKDFLVVDARSAGRFNGTENEPRKHLQSGNIQNSVNIPYQDVLSDGKFKSQDKLHELFESKCSAQKDLVFSCGSGLTACIIMLANNIAYGDSIKIYDGSWTEWAELNNLTNDISK